MKKLKALMFSALALLALPVLAQTAPIPPLDWGYVGALALNGVGVFLAVWAINNVLFPALRTRAPWAIPLLAMVAGSVVQYATEFLFQALGHPVDLSPILGALTGAGATAAHQVYAQSSKGKA